MTLMRPTIFIALLACALATPLAYANSTYTIGNSTPSTDYYVQGQSFTPSVQGNIGTGTAPSSGTVYLTSFSFDFLGSGPADLYIYTFQPAATDAATGVGALATGIYSGGVYSFSGTALDVGTKYYAVLSTPADIYDGYGGTGTDTYTGGTDMFTDGSTILEGGYIYDTGFSATFATTPEPSSLLLTLSGTLVTALFLARRRSATAA